MSFWARFDSTRLRSASLYTMHALWRAALTHTHEHTQADTEIQTG